MAAAVTSTTKTSCNSGSLQRMVSGQAGPPIRRCPVVTGIRPARIRRCRALGKAGWWMRVLCVAQSPDDPHAGLPGAGPHPGRSCGNGVTNKPTPLRPTLRWLRNCREAASQAGWRSRGLPVPALRPSRHPATRAALRGSACPCVSKCQPRGLQTSESASSSAGQPCALRSSSQDVRIHIPQ